MPLIGSGPRAPANAPPSRIVVTGASGNVGSGVLRALARRMPEAEGRRGVPSATNGREASTKAFDGTPSTSPRRPRPPSWPPPWKPPTSWSTSRLAVQPVDDEAHLYRANVLGSQCGPGLRWRRPACRTWSTPPASGSTLPSPLSPTVPVTEDWPDTGQPTSTYSRHKVVVERMLDDFTERHPEITVARFRPTVVVQRQAAHLIRSLYLGPLVPRALFGLLRRRPLPAAAATHRHRTAIRPRRRCRRPGDPAHRAPFARFLQRRGRRLGHRRASPVSSVDAPSPSTRDGCVPRSRVLACASDGAADAGLVRRRHQYPSHGYLQGA